MLSGGGDPASATQRALGMIYHLLQQQAALLSYTEIFRLMGMLFLAVIPLVLLMHRASARTTAAAH